MRNGKNPMLNYDEVAHFVGHQLRGHKTKATASVPLLAIAQCTLDGPRRSKIGKDRVPLPGLGGPSRFSSTDASNFFSTTSGSSLSRSLSMSMTASQSSFARVPLQPLLQGEGARAQEGIAKDEFTAHLLQESGVTTQQEYQSQQIEGMTSGDSLQQRLLHHEQQFQQLEQKISGAREVLRHSLPSIHPSTGSISLQTNEKDSKEHEAFSKSRSMTHFPPVEKEMANRQRWSVAGSIPEKIDMEGQRRRTTSSFFSSPTGSKERRGSGSLSGEVGHLQQLQTISAGISSELDNLCASLELLEKRHELTDEERELQEYRIEEETRRRTTLRGSVSGIKPRKTVRTSRATVRKTMSRRSEPQNNFIREQVRQKLSESAGGENAAYRSLDCNGNGEISISEFMDGLNRLKIPWKELTGLTKREDLFKIFDLDNSGQMDLQELFPEEAAEQARLRATTPEWWHGQWVRHNRDCNGTDTRPAKWVNDTEGTLQDLLIEKRATDQAVGRRRWMKETIKRLRHNGKSSAACRELVARHIPEGTGPKDDEGIQAFSREDVQNCRRMYFDQVNANVRKIQSVVYDLRAQRKDLQESRYHLGSITQASAKALQEEERKKKVKEGGFGGGALNKAKRQTIAESSTSFELNEEEMSEEELWLRAIGKKLEIPLPDIEQIYKMFQGFDKDGSGNISKDEFGNLLHTLLQQHLTQADIDAKWKSLLSLKFEPAPGKPAKKMQEPESSEHFETGVDFEHFFMYFSGLGS